MNEKMTINKNRLYVMTAPIEHDSKDRRYVHVNLEDGPYLAVFQNLEDPKIFMECMERELPTLNQAECIEMTLEELYEETKECEYPGVAFSIGYVIRPCDLDELEDLMIRSKK